MTWQRDLARTRQPRLKPLHIPAGVRCICGHPRSSHTAAVFSGKCHVVSNDPTPYEGGNPGWPGSPKPQPFPPKPSDWIENGRCSCLSFDARCGCGHLLSAHAWGTPPEPWACSSCVCKQFGAKVEM